jgi:hypothetical protein
MNLHESIKKAVDNNKNKTELTKNSIANLVLLSISQDKYFNDTYSSFTISKSKDPEINGLEHFVIVNPALNEIKGSKNGMLPSKFIDVYETFEQGYDCSPFQNDNDTYMLKKNISTIEIFKNILKSSKNFDEVNNKLEKEQNENNEFFHRLHILFSSESMNKNPTQKFLNISYQLAKFSEDLKGIKYNIKLKNELYLDYYNIHKKEIRDDTIRDSFNLYSFSNLSDKNRLFLIKQIAVDGFSDNELTMLLKDNKLNKIPDDIQELLDNKGTQKNIFNLFRKKYKNDVLSVLFSQGNEEDRKVSFCEKQFDLLKKASIEEIENNLNIKNSVEDLLEKHKSVINPIRETVISTYPQFKEKNINFEIVDKKVIYERVPKESFCTTLEKNNLLSIFNDYEIDIIAKGLHFLNNENIESDKSFNKTYILLKDHDQVIGVTTLTHKGATTAIKNTGISDPYKQTGLLKELYQEIANYSIRNKKIITSQVYTAEGRKYIPKVKNDIINKNTNAFFLRGELEGQTSQNKITQEINFDIISTLEKIDIDIDVDFLKKQYEIHLNVAIGKINEIDAHDFKNRDFKNNIIEKALTNINQSIIEIQTHKNKYTK